MVLIDRTTREVQPEQQVASILLQFILFKFSDRSMLNQNEGVLFIIPSGTCEPTLLIAVNIFSSQQISI